MTAFDKKKYIDLEFNGYRWFSHFKGVHSFQKKLNDGRWGKIECSEEQLNNGDIQFMAEHEMTLSSKLKLKVNKLFDK